MKIATSHVICESKITELELKLNFEVQYAMPSLNCLSVSKIITNTQDQS